MSLCQRPVLLGKTLAATQQCTRCHHYLKGRRTQLLLLLLLLLGSLVSELQAS